MLEQLKISMEEMYPYVISNFIYSQVDILTYYTYVIVQEMLELGKRLLKEQGFNPDDKSQVR
jgi:hypothetical protein